MTLNELAGQFPEFLRQTIALVRGPKRFMAGRSLQTTDELKSAMIYYSLAVVVSLALELPFLSSMGEFSDRLPTAVIVLVLGLALSTAFITAALKLFGGGLGFMEHLVVTLYLWGVGVLIWTTGAFITKGIMLLGAPEFFDIYLVYMDEMLAGSAAAGDERFAALLQTDAILYSMLFFAFVQVVLFTWFIYTWGIYRVLNGMSRGRAGLALVFCLMGLYPLTRMLLAAQLGAGVTIF